MEFLETFQELLEAAVDARASDLHLKPNARPIFRINGRLVPQEEREPLTWEFMEGLVKRVLGPQRQSLLQEGREVDRSYMVPGLGRFRVNVFLSKAEIRAVLRIIPNRIPNFEELHLPSVLEKLSTERRGLVLVTGITGSGKSTTLASMIDYMNRHREDHIITIEDPIEFLHEDKRCLVTQREIGQDSQTFAQALRAALRQDPDIILVGEMRDEETMATAITAAETGHLVLSTMHTLNATETVNRILATFPPHQEGQIRLQLAAVLQGVVSQRLVERADGAGRVPAVEVMLGTGLIKDCIREPEKTATIPAVIAAGQSQYGMQVFDQSLLTLYRQEFITYETAMAAASNPDDFALKVRGILSAGEMSWEVGGAEPAQPDPKAVPKGGGSSFFRR
ncbi:MAG TPA: type IV pilus twitching motility protein PilT [Methylomirabilota bacterium]|nr:type IV pilus twitching motility protein PilT [Methylomirabilota bacterium]